MPDNEGGQFIAITDIMEEDGRIGAFTVGRGAEGDSTAFVIFAYEGDRWLIDEVIELSTGRLDRPVAREEKIKTDGWHPRRPCPSDMPSRA